MDPATVPGSISQPALVVLAGLLALLGVILTHEVRAWNRLAHIPGPWWSRNTFTSTYWLLKKALAGHLHSDFRGLTDRYGAITRLSPTDVLTDDLGLLRRMSAVRSPYTKSSWYAAWRVVPKQDHTFSMVDEAAHAERRGKVAPAYGGKFNDSMEGCIDAQILSLVDLIERGGYLAAPPSSPSSFRPLDFSRTAQFFALDVISDLAWGVPFGFLRADADLHDYLRLFDDFFPIMTTISVVPGLPWLMQQWPMSLLQPTPGDKEGFGSLTGHAKSVIEARLAPGAEERPDMLGGFIARGLSFKEITNESYLQIVAGADTTASALRCTLLHLISTPTAYAGLVREITYTVSTSTRLSPSTPVFPDSTLRSLPYLQAVIREGLRMLPPATGFLGKRVPDGGDWAEADVVRGAVGGGGGFATPKKRVFLPGGTRVGSSVFGLMRRRDIWGDDAECFRPERWLEAGAGENDERGRTMREALDWCFGFGKYQCLGKAVAWMELDKAVFELLRRYDFASVNAIEPIKISSAGFYLMSDQIVRVTRREIST